MLQRIAWLLLAAIHVMPAIALFRPALVTTLYGVARSDSTFPLLQHRAALFLAIVMICGWAAIDPGARRVATVLTGISMITFLLLYWLADAPPALRAIALVDLAGLPALAYVASQMTRGG